MGFGTNKEKYQFKMKMGERQVNTEQQMQTDVDPCLFRTERSHKEWWLDGKDGSGE